MSTINHQDDYPIYNEGYPEASRADDNQDGVHPRGIGYSGGTKGGCVHRAPLNIITSEPLTAALSAIKDMQKLAQRVITGIEWVLEDWDGEQAREVANMP